MSLTRFVLFDKGTWTPCYDSVTALRPIQGCMGH